MELYFKGLLIGVFSFLVIGLFHPIVIKTEYYTGTRFWWVFLIVGILCCCGALLCADIVASSMLSVLGFSSFIDQKQLKPSTLDIVASSMLSVLGFSCFWSIKELFEQRERVQKGWFPKNPRRHYDD